MGELSTGTDLVGEGRSEEGDADQNCCKQGGYGEAVEHHHDLKIEWG